jgi:predicted TIM-barrel fold metal-dependent hydrolase
MFASNFPVDKVAGPGTALPALFHDLHALVSDLPEAQQAALLHDTAARVYRLHA